MDLLFHAVVGAAIGECAPKRIQHRQLKGVAGALLPDLANLPSYLYLGMKTNSTLWYPAPEAFCTLRRFLIERWGHQSRMMFSLFRAWCHMPFSRTML